ncbi:MAG: Rne/Rng family ribonuclease [Nitrospinota bacterium]|nr:MAG: Rne/Rng family ribonuclease [Nitrospinota bacterium]
MASEIIINADARETRVGLLENGVLAELYIERAKDRGIVGNIYKGKVTKVLPGMQAAFVDIGLRKAGFLYVSDIDAPCALAAYEKIAGEEEEELFAEEESKEFSRRRVRRGHPGLPIEEILQEGQEILVQVSKEPIGTKGARITSYITLPGRYLVLMPGVDHIGVSRRIEDEEERKRLKEILKQEKVAGSGYIVRTVSEGIAQEEILSDIDFLNTLWRDIQQRSEQVQAPALIHQDLDLVLRAIRDLYTSDVERLVIDSPAEYEKCLEFVSSYLPHLHPHIELYTGREPIFDAYGIEMEIERALERKIWLKSGGYIVIDQTEALVAIDVNTGRFVGKHDPEETIVKTNLEAIQEIVYQIRLRNIGGIIIIDFIDMEKEESREKVLNTLIKALKTDRSRTKILQFSELGLVEMTRKRVRESLGRVLCHPCPYCDGRGAIKSPTTVGYEVLREIKRTASAPDERKKVLVTVHPVVADLLLDEEHAFLEQLEQSLHKEIVIKGDYDLHQDQYEVILL